MTLLLHIIVPELRSSLFGWMKISHLTSMLLTFLLMAITSFSGVTLILDFKTICTIIGFATHYFFLSRYYLASNQPVFFPFFQLLLAQYHELWYLADLQKHDRLWQHGNQYYFKGEFRLGAFTIFRWTGCMGRGRGSSTTPCMLGGCPWSFPSSQSSLNSYQILINRI